MRRWWVLLMVVGCDASSEEPTPSTESGASTQGPAPASTPEASARKTTDPAPSAVPSATASVAPTVASLRAQAAANPAAFEKKAVTLRGFFVKKYSWTLSLRPEADDTIQCEYREDHWPSPGLKPGNAVEVKGQWSFDQFLPGGHRPGGGPLHVANCVVSPAAPETPASVGR